MGPEALIVLAVVLLAILLLALTQAPPDAVLVAALFLLVEAEKAVLRWRQARASRRLLA